MLEGTCGVRKRSAASRHRWKGVTYPTSGDVSAWAGGAIAGCCEQFDGTRERVGGGDQRPMNPQRRAGEYEIESLEEALEGRQEEVSEEEVAEVEEGLREGDESGQAEADDSEVTEVERETEES
jgi:hypothetical protein